MKKKINIIGISCYYHDSAAALVQDGKVVNAIQEERLSRIKHDSSFPINSINYCTHNLATILNQMIFIRPI